MLSAQNPTEPASPDFSPHATDPDIEDVNELDGRGDISEVSDGENLRDDLEDALKGDFHFRGKFALSETFKSTPLPGLHIEGVGMVGFPLSEHDAKLIETVATQAPFGKGTETVVDTTVRDTFEINSNKISFKNPSWVEFLQTVIKNVTTGLGLPTNRPLPRVDLYKLLLYRTGSHFLPHKDTEKSQGMFASLIIVLPSKFEGGEVHVSHGNNKDVFNISPFSEFTTSALAWYTDVIHEVKPVTSGYRLAISYNLVNTSPGLPPPHPPEVHSAVTVIENIFRKWRREAYYEGDANGYIVYLLDHEYSDAGLQFSALKGRDAALVSHIREVAEKQGVSLCLGLLECRVEGAPDTDTIYSSDPKMEEVYEREYRIKGLYDLEGDLVDGSPIVLDPESDMIPRDPGFDYLDPDEKEGGDYTGNEAAELTYLYRSSVLVMSLEEDVESPLRMGGASYMVKKLQKRRAEGPSERNKQMAWSLLNRGHFALYSSRSLTAEASVLIGFAFEWGDLAIFQKVLEKSACGKYKPQLSLDVVRQACGVFAFDRIKHLIEKVIRDQPSTVAAIEFISAFRVAVPTQDPGVVAWSKQQTILVLSSIEVAPSAADARVFADIAESEGVLFFSQTIVKQLVQFRGLFSFWVDLAGRLWKNKDKLIPSEGTPEETSAYTTSLNHIMDSLIAAAIPEHSNGATLDHYGRSTYANTETQDSACTLKLLDILVLTHRTHYSSQLIASASQLEGNILAKREKFITSLVPKLKARYRQYNSSEFPMLDAFLRALVERWLQDILGSPSQRPDPAVKKLSCDCQDCKNVNRFLLSDSATETFWALQGRRSHMADRIRTSVSGDVTSTTVTTRRPYGLQLTKTQARLATDRWNVRVESARAFLSLVGTPDELARIMGDRYQDIQAALAGAKPYKIGTPTSDVALVENAPVASTSTDQAAVCRTQAGPVLAGTKRKAEDEGEMIDLTSD